MEKKHLPQGEPLLPPDPTILQPAAKAVSCNIAPEPPEALVPKTVSSVASQPLYSIFASLFDQVAYIHIIECDIDGSDDTDKVDELSKVTVGSDETETVEVPSAFRIPVLLVLLLLLDLLHIVSVKPRIATKNTCHSLSFHMIPPTKLRLINT